MPRFLTTICDPNTQEIANHISHAMDEISGLLSHPWVQDTYRDTYITSVLRKDTYEETVAIFYEYFSWVVSCENLDEKIMSALNGGDSSASCSQQQD